MIKKLCYAFLIIFFIEIMTTGCAASEEAQQPVEADTTVTTAEEPVADDIKESEPEQADTELDVVIGSSNTDNIPTSVLESISDRHTEYASSLTGTSDSSDEVDFSAKVDAEQLLANHPGYTARYGYISAVHNQIVDFTECPPLTVPCMQYAVGAQILASDGRVYTVDDFSKYVEALFYDVDESAYEEAKECCHQGDEYIDDLCFVDDAGEIFAAAATIEGDSSIVINRYFVSSFHQNAPGEKAYVLYPAFYDSLGYTEPCAFVGSEYKLRIADDAVIELNCYGAVDDTWDGIDMDKGAFLMYDEPYDIPVGIIINESNEIIYICRRFFS